MKDPPVSGVDQGVLSPPSTPEGGPSERVGSESTPAAYSPLPPSNPSLIGYQASGEPDRLSTALLWLMYVALALLFVLFVLMAIKDFVR